ncbi:hypothetical protein L9F63_018961 [Diploptera punctata]|uniref:Uncharacterized protein n=1 Tax=Diploptera punctata TaxID=6984 RepID=A0AAD8EF60_DIPPU|nr:hypothetical protein L9F63_018961 [Diploptera punctata]
MNMKSDNIENEFNQQNMPIEEDDSSTPVQLATSVGSSSSQQYENQTPEPPDGEQRNPCENQMQYLSMQKGHKTTDTGEEGRSDIMQKIDNIMDLLNNKLDKIIEEKNKQPKESNYTSTTEEKSGGRWSPNKTKTLTQWPTQQRKAEKNRRRTKL